MKSSNLKFAKNIESTYSTWDRINYFGNLYSLVKEIPSICYLIISCFSVALRERYFSNVNIRKASRHFVFEMFIRKPRK